MFVLFRLARWCFGVYCFVFFSGLFLRVYYDGVGLHVGFSFDYVFSGETLFWLYFNWFDDYCFVVSCFALWVEFVFDVVLHLLMLIRLFYFCLCWIGFVVIGFLFRFLFRFMFCFDIRFDWFLLFCWGRCGLLTVGVAFVVAYFVTVVLVTLCICVLCLFVFRFNGWLGCLYWFCFVSWFGLCV